MCIQLSLTDLIAAVMTRLQDTGLPVYDAVPANTDAPFYKVELAGMKPADTKTCFRTVYNVYIHVIDAAGDSHVPIFGYVRRMQEAMTQDIELPDGYNLHMQRDLGMIRNGQDETGENHIVWQYEIAVSYGLKIK